MGGVVAEALGLDDRQQARAHRLGVRDVALAGRAVATLSGTRHDIGPGDALVVNPDEPFTLANEQTAPFEAVVCMRCGGEARVGDETFAPPWAV